MNSPGKPKAPKFKLKKYNVPDENFVVVQNPWGFGRDKLKNTQFLNNVSGWFERMTRCRPITIYHQGTHDSLIVELPAHVDIGPFLGSHRARDFLKLPSSQHVSVIYEYDYSKCGDPAKKQWIGGYATYGTLDPRFPAMSPYPPARKGPYPTIGIAKPLPKHLQGSSEEPAYSEPPPDEQPAPAPEEATLPPHVEDPLPAANTSAFTPYVPPPNYIRPDPPKAKSKMDPYEEEEDAARFLRSVKDEPMDAPPIAFVKPEPMEGRLIPVETSPPLVKTEALPPKIPAKTGPATPRRIKPEPAEPRVKPEPAEPSITRVKPEPSEPPIPRVKPEPEAGTLHNPPLKSEPYQPSQELQDLFNRLVSQGSVNQDDTGTRTREPVARIARPLPGRSGPVRVKQEADVSPPAAVVKQEHVEEGDRAPMASQNGYRPSQQLEAIAKVQAHPMVKPEKVDDDLLRSAATSRDPRIRGQVPPEVIKRVKEEEAEEERRPVALTRSNKRPKTEDFF